MATIQQIGYLYPREVTFKRARAFMHDFCLEALGSCDKVVWLPTDDTSPFGYSLTMTFELGTKLVNSFRIGKLTHPEYLELVETLESFITMVHESAAA